MRQTSITRTRRPRGSGEDGDGEGEDGDEDGESTHCDGSVECDGAMGRGMDLVLKLSI